MWFIVSLCSILIAHSSADSADFQCLQQHQEGEITRHFFVKEYDLPFRIQTSHRVAHQLASHILKFLLREVIGYTYVYVSSPQDDTSGEDTNETLRQISTCKTPKNCSKVDAYGPEVMINVEVWLTPGFNIEEWVETGQIDVLGPLGPVGRSGWYIAEYIVKYFWESNNTVIDHWRAFHNA
ncbi:uncharacterized protein CEXT_74351 [Caerostris extrusa]|uniref:Uncharacterized protein n=1 Tax=Caerostris extrusa TaxID=172846 RepID=A0AAV4SFY1_CAEEX|nr:uncharacterized protein CEXT_74351 [Caerostris extrusa]